MLFAYFSVGEDAVTLCGDNEDDSNSNLKDLALLYPDLPGLVRKVQNRIETGSATSDCESFHDGVACDHIPAVLKAASFSSEESLS